MRSRLWILFIYFDSKHQNLFDKKQAFDNGRHKHDQNVLLVNSKVKEVVLLCVLFLLKFHILGND